MASTIRIKRSGTSGNPSTLAAGELAYSSLTDNGANGGDRLYIGTGVETAGDAANHIVIGGKYFTDMLDHTKGTLTANSAIITDANSKIDNIKIDNIDINGNTISSTDVDGNIVLDPNGNGVVSVNSSKITNLSAPTSDQDAATKLYVDNIVGGSGIQLTYAGDTGSHSLAINDSDLTIAGGTGLSTSVSADTLTVNLDSTGVAVGTYGSTTQIPVFTVNAQGQLDSAGSVAISTSFTIAGDSGSDTFNTGETLTFVGTDPVQTGISNNQLTISVDNATTTTTGIASFADSNFTVSSGEVTSKAFTIGSTEINLGETTTTLAGLTQLDVDNIRILDNTVASSTGVLYIDPNPIDSDGGEVIIRGSLTVQGTTTTVNSTTVSINDKNIVLADSAATAGEADGAGLTINGPTTPATILYNGSTDRWDLNKALNLSDSIGAALFFDGTAATEAIEDHLVNNFLLAGEGIDLTYVDASNQLTISAELATVSNPGVANFDSDQFTVTSGLASIYNIDGGEY